MEGGVGMPHQRKPTGAALQGQQPLAVGTKATKELPTPGRGDATDRIGVDVGAARHRVTRKRQNGWPERADKAWRLKGRAAR
jgi:hypothetical protein